MSLDKSLQIYGKSWKIILNPKGCSYRPLYKQGNEDGKKEENSEQQALKCNKLIPTRATTSHVHCSSLSFDRRLCKLIPFLKRNLLTDLELKPFLSGNLSFGNKLTSEYVFLWVIIRSFMYSALKSLMFGKVLRGKYEFPASSFPEKCSVGGEGGGQEQKKFAWRKGDLGRGR